jgi:hypothetical protein
VTLAPSLAAPTRILTVTASPVVIPIATVAELPVVTLESMLDLITPSPLPTRTPTLTPTITLTPPPTHTLTATLFALPTRAPSGPPLATAPPVGCPAAWFFTNPIPAACPLNPPFSGAASWQPFQSGLMVWLASQGAVYALYDTPNAPRWQVFRDGFQEGMPETDPAFNSSPPNTWQPRRGFGLVWRTGLDVRTRLGWAVMEFEVAYTAQIQTAADGTIFMTDPRGGVLALSPNGTDWLWYPG